MTLKSVPLKPKYISLEDDVAKLFYVPVMSNCIRFDRISCYFAFDAIAKYCTGIYYLGKNNGKFRLIISVEIVKKNIVLKLLAVNIPLPITPICSEFRFIGLQRIRV